MFCNKISVARQRECIKMISNHFKILKTCKYAFNVCEFIHFSNSIPDNNRKTIVDKPKLRLFYKKEHKSYYYNTKNSWKQTINVFNSIFILVKAIKKENNLNNCHIFCFTTSHNIKESKNKTEKVFNVLKVSYITGFCLNNIYIGDI